MCVDIIGDDREVCVDIIGEDDGGVCGYNRRR